jgi:hypothetical protein
MEDRAKYRHHRNPALSSIIVAIIVAVITAGSGRLLHLHPEMKVVPSVVAAVRSAGLKQISLLTN